MFRLDHFALFAQNFYEATFKISQETGLGNYDGGYFPNYGAAIKIVPLGPDLFLEIEGLVDMAVIKRELANPTEFLQLGIRKRETFAGWCFRTDTEEELEAFAKVRGCQIDRNFLNIDNAQQMMNGDKNVVIMAPLAPDSWPKGMPNVYFWPDMSKHDARYPVQEGTGAKTPLGLAWVEVGGDAAQFDEWFGGLTTASDHPLRCNGKAPGLYALAVATGE